MFFFFGAAVSVFASASAFGTAAGFSVSVPSCFPPKAFLASAISLSSMELMWLFTSIFFPLKNSRSSLLLFPSSFASSYTFIFDIQTNLLYVT